MMKSRKFIITIIVVCAIISVVAAFCAIIAGIMTGSNKNIMVDVQPGIHMPDAFSSQQATQLTPAVNNSDAAVDSTIAPTIEPTPEPTEEPTPDPTEEQQTSSDRIIDPTKPMIALSFDDGPKASTTSRILDLIEKYDISATFFVVGDMAKNNKEMLRREIALGCEIGNHTMTHNIYFKTADQADIDNEIEQVNEIVKDATGYTPRLVRPPYGSCGATALANAKYPYILWSVDTEDWKSRDKDAVFAEVQKSTFDGCIILMHDIYASTADACEMVIPWLLEQGYQIVNVSELFEARGIALDPGATYRQARPQK